MCINAYADVCAIMVSDAIHWLLVRFVGEHCINLASGSKPASSINGSTARCFALFTSLSLVLSWAKQRTDKTS
jgi:hypothetical protein